ncbi:MAG TPA: class I SAM-dependent methyltransferase [Nitrososphaeraceae archaeon]|jgi:ubiquinone/menaquinone biosynthesis C-methylase UbiE
MNLLLTIKEYISSIDSKKRIELLRHYVNPKPNDVILDIGGNTGKISEAAYSCNGCNQIVVLEPKSKYVEYGRFHRPFIRFIEGCVESIPLPDESVDTVVASFSFHHFRDHDKGLEEMKRVLKSGNGRLIIFESNPLTTRGKTLMFIENLFHTDAKFYDSDQLKEKLAQEHNLKVISIIFVSIGYFLIAFKE